LERALTKWPKAIVLNLSSLTIQEDTILQHCSILAAAAAAAASKDRRDPTLGLKHQQSFVLLLEDGDKILMQREEDFESIIQHTHTQSVHTNTAAKLHNLLTCHCA
jgi:hypothetical protein